MSPLPADTARGLSDAEFIRLHEGCADPVVRQFVKRLWERIDDECEDLRNANERADQAEHEARMLRCSVEQLRDTLAVVQRFLEADPAPGTQATKAYERANIEILTLVCDTLRNNP